MEARISVREPDAGATAGKGQAWKPNLLVERLSPVRVARLGLPAFGDSTMKLSLLFFVAACAMDGQTAPTAPKTSSAPTATSTAAAPAQLPGTGTDPGAVVATWNGGQITYGELATATGGQVKKLEIDYLQN